MTINSEKPSHGAWRVPRIICGILIIILALYLLVHFTLDFWDDFTHPMYPLSWQEKIFFLILSSLILSFCYFLFSIGMSLVKRGKIRQNWVSLTSVGKSSSHSGHTLFVIFGSLAAFLGFLGMIMLALFTLISLASAIRLLPPGEFLSVDPTIFGWIFVFWYLVFSAGIFLLQRSEMSYLLSAASSKKIAWAYKSISVYALLNLTQRLGSNYFKSFILWNKSAGTRAQILLGLSVATVFCGAGLAWYFLPESAQSPSEINYSINMEYAECVAQNMPVDFRNIATLKPLEILSPKERGIVLGCAVNSRRVFMVRWALGAKTDSILVDQKLSAVYTGQISGRWPMATIASWSDSNAAIEALKLLDEREDSIFPASVIEEQRLAAAYNVVTVEVARYLDDHWPDLLQGEAKRLSSPGQASFDYSNLSLAQYHALKGRFNLAQYFADQGSKLQPMRHLVFDIERTHKERAYLFDEKLDQFLASRGDTIDERDAQNRTLLHRAVEENEGGLVRQLLTRGADVNAQDVAGDTPLHYAVRRNDSTFLPLMLDSANVNARNLKGRTPLHEALATSAWDAATAMLNKGARLDVRDTLGRTPLFDCVQQACPLLDRLMESDSDLGVVDEEGNTLLHLAAQTNGDKADLIGKLIAKGVPVNLKNKEGKTPLLLLSESGDVDSVNLLLAKGCDPNQVDAMGNTPLHLAQTTDMALALLSAGANPDLVNMRGVRPVDGSIARTQMLFHSPSQINSKTETLPHYFRDIRMGEESVVLSSPAAGTIMLGGDDSDEAKNGAIWFIARDTGLKYRVEQACQTSVLLAKGNDTLTLKPLPDSNWTALTSADRTDVFLVRGQATSCTISKVNTGNIMSELMRKGKLVLAKWQSVAKRCNGSAKDSCQVLVTPVLRVSVKEGENWINSGVLSVSNFELPDPRGTGKYFQAKPGG